jgi:hypothetical protein
MGPYEHGGAAVKIPTLGIILGLLAAMFIGGVRAHDAPTDWIGQERRTNAAGISCCGKGDCFPFTAAQIKVRPDGYHFPDGHVASFQSAAPSVDGFWWKCEWGGEVKCVFAPMGGS